MSAVSMTDGQLAQLAVPDPRAALQGRGVSPSEFGMGLQLMRASTMATTRLQLALIRGDRRQAMDAMDWLLDIDSEIECFVGGMSPPRPDDPNWQAITTHLIDQKAAIAFEKHALAGGVIGPEPGSSSDLADGAGDTRSSHGTSPAAVALTGPAPGPVGINPWLLALLLLTVIGALAAFGTLIS